MQMIQSFRKCSRLNTEMSACFESIEVVKKLIEGIQRNVVALKKKHEEILSLPTTNDIRQQELNVLNTKIKSNSHTVRSKLKALENNIQQAEEKILGTSIDIETSTDENVPLSPGGKYIPASLRMQKVQHSSWVKVFSEVMNDYESTQTEYLSRCRSRLKTQLKITNSNYSEEEIENMIQEGNFTVYTQGLVTETKQAKKSLAEIQARHNDLMKLEKSVVELHSMVQEMATLVQTQGNVVENIHTQISRSQVYVESGVEEIRQGFHEQKKVQIRKLKLGLLVLVVVIVLIIIIVIYICL